MKGIFVYYDVNGVLKEVINDAPLRQGNSNINTIFVYWEGSNENITSGWVNVVLPDGTYFGNLPFGVSKVEKMVPYNKDREPKFFQYNTPYSLYKINLTEIFEDDDDRQDQLFASEGSLAISIRFATSEKIFTMGLLALYVEPDPFSIKIDENINVAQWNALMKTLPAWVSELPEVKLYRHTLTLNKYPTIKLYYLDGTTEEVTLDYAAKEIIVFNNNLNNINMINLGQSIYNCLENYFVIGPNTFSGVLDRVSSYNIGFEIPVIINTLTRNSKLVVRATLKFAEETTISDDVIAY